MTRWIMVLSLVLAACASSQKKGAKTAATAHKGTRPPAATTADAGYGVDGSDATDESGEVAYEPTPLERIYFQYDSSTLDPEAIRTLGRNAELMRAQPELVVSVEGHCDERGTEEYNLALGDRRARVARDYLVHSGIDAARLSHVSYGELRPASTGHDDASHAQNRRAEFVGQVNAAAIGQPTPAQAQRP